MAEERLTDDEVALVLRRASELDSGGASQQPGLPVAAVEAAAAEVGLTPAAVRQAVAELRAGALHDDGAPVVCARVVPAACPDAIEAVGRWLQGQAMARARDRGTEQVWRPREDWFAGVQRRFDFAAAIRLRGVDEVVVRGVEVEGGTLVRIVVRLEGAKAAAPTIGAGVGLVLGGAAGVGVGLGTELAWLVDAGLVAAGSGAGGFGGWRVGRRSLAEHRRRVAESLDGLLDELELGRQPGSRHALDRLASRARRLRGGYRL